MDVNDPFPDYCCVADGGTTSASLRAVKVALHETQRALAASQADLTRVERERDAALNEVTAIQIVSAVLKCQRDEAAERHRLLWGMERDAQVKLRQRLLATQAELASARTELANLRHTDTPRTDAPGSNEGELPQ